MNYSSRKVKVRSFIFDMPTNSHFNSPNIEETVLIDKRSRLSPPLSMCSFTSRQNLKHSPSRCSSGLPDEEVELSEKQKEFCLTYLPYIYAQNGYSHLNSVLAAMEKKTQSKNLHLNRKKREADIFAEEKTAKPALVRNRTLEISKSNFQ